MKKLFILMMLAIGLCCAVSGQGKPRSAYYDSLIGALPQLPEDTIKARLYGQIAWHYVNIDTKLTQTYVQKTKKLAYQLGWKKGLAEMLGVIAVKLESTGNAALGLEYAFEARKIYEETGDTGKEIDILLDIASFFENGGNYKKEIEYTNIALQKALTNGDNQKIGLVNFQKGKYYRAIENLDSALYFTLKAIDYISKSTAKSTLPDYLTGAGNIYIAQKKYPEALVYYNRALSELDEQKQTRSRAFTLINIGNVHYLNNDLENALKYYQQSLAQAQAIDDFFYVGASYSNLGDIYLGLANDTFKHAAASSVFPKNKKALIEKCINYYDSSIKAFKDPRNDNIIFLAEVYKHLADVLNQQGNYKRGSEMLLAHLALKDSAYAADNAARMTKLETMRELDIKDKQIIIDQLEVEKKNTEKKFYIVGLCLSLLAAALALFAYRQKSRDNKTIKKLVNEQEQTIAERTQQLAHANSKLVELIRYNAHNMREPLARVMGAMIIQDYMSSEEFYAEIWPQMQKAVADLDTTIKEVIDLADDTVKLYG